MCLRFWHLVGEKCFLAANYFQLWFDQLSRTCAKLLLVTLLYYCFHSVSKCRMSESWIKRCAIWMEKRNWYCLDANAGGLLGQVIANPLIWQQDNIGLYCKSSKMVELRTVNKSEQNSCNEDIKGRCFKGWVMFRDFGYILVLSKVRKYKWLYYVLMYLWTACSVSTNIKILNEATFNTGP